MTTPESLNIKHNTPHILQRHHRYLSLLETSHTPLSISNYDILLQSTEAKWVWPWSVPEGETYFVLLCNGWKRSQAPKVGCLLRCSG